MVRIFLDAGHGGYDSGARGNGLLEKDVTLDITLRVGKILKAAGAIVGYSRTTDTFVSLNNIAAASNRFKADYFVSIHANSFHDAAAHGVETYMHPIGKGFTLAHDIQGAMCKDKSLCRADRGVKTANFTVLARTNAASALVEIGFISNPQDAAIMRDRPQEIAEAIAKGILKTAGLNVPVKKKEVAHWAVEAQEWVQAEDISDGTRPLDNVTRQEVWTMLHRMKGGN